MCGAWRRRGRYVVFRVCTVGSPGPAIPGSAGYILRSQHFVERTPWEIAATGSSAAARGTRGSSVLGADNPETTRWFPTLATMQGDAARPRPASWPAARRGKWLRGRVGLPAGWRAALLALGLAACSLLATVSTAAAPARRTLTTPAPGPHPRTNAPAVLPNAAARKRPPPGGSPAARLPPIDAPPLTTPYHPSPTPPRQTPTRQGAAGPRRRRQQHLGHAGGDRPGAGAVHRGADCLLRRPPRPPQSRAAKRGGGAAVRAPPAAAAAGMPSLSLHLGAAPLQRIQI
jgi:hypothetical protein